MKRTGIFCIYTPTGEVDSTILNTINELRENVTYLIIVCNGYSTKICGLGLLADEVVMRENVGLDVGAYTDIILSPNYMNIIKNSDELVLCNNSFYGPFVSFREIFEKMENSPADFWGISSSEKNFVQHIQSYFIVFRKRILEGKELYRYLKERVNIRRIDYFGACSIFENGLFWTLKNAGYQFDAYRRNITCDNYLNPYGSVKIDGVPVLKRKVFSKEFYQMKEAVSALGYIKKIYHYDITPILNSIFCDYGIRLGKSEIREDIAEKAVRDIFQSPELVAREEVERFIKSHEKVFIYGNGAMARTIFSCFFFYEKHPKLQGFIISDDQPIVEQNFRGYPIYNFSEVKDKQTTAILVALNKKNTQVVINQLKGMNDVKLLWK